MSNMLSVIIPVYNVEKYLPSCLDSVLSQSYAEMEVILVDDGSSDSSGAICDLYAAKDSRIKVLHTENKGVSKARNLALDHAEGEWITFVDSDDIIPQGTFQLYVDTAEKHNVPLVMAHMRFDKDADGSEYIVPRLNTGLHYQNDTEVFMCESLRDWKLSFCGKNFHKSLLEDVRFPEDIPSYEDFTALCEVALKHPSYAIIPEVGYIARCRPDSASRSRNGIVTYRKRVKSLCFICNRMSGLFVNKPSLVRMLSGFVISEGLACRDIYGKFGFEDKEEVIVLTERLWQSMKKHCAIPWYMRLLLRARVQYIKKNINNYPIWQYAPIRIAMRFL